MASEPGYGVRQCRGHWHVTVGSGKDRDDVGGTYPTEDKAWESAALYHAEFVWGESVTLLKRLASAEEDRFNESGIYIPNENPTKLRAIADALLTCEADALLARATLSSRDERIAVLEQENAKLKGN